MLGMAAQMRDALDRRRAGTNDRHPFVGKLCQPTLSRAARVTIVPAAGVEAVTPEALDTGDAGQLRPIQRTAGDDHEAGVHGVTAVGGDQPSVLVLQPAHRADLGLEAGQPIEIECLADPARMRTDLVAETVFFLRDVAGLFQQRQVDVAFDVALRAWISIPVPGAAEVAAFLDDANILDPGLAQARRRQQSAEAAAHDHHVDRVGEWLAGKAGIDVRILDKVPKIAGCLHVLIIAVGPQPPVALVTVLLAQCIGIKIERLAHVPLPLILSDIQNDLAKKIQASLCRTRNFCESGSGTPMRPPTTLGSLAPLAAGLSHMAGICIFTSL